MALVAYRPASRRVPVLLHTTFRYKRGAIAVSSCCLRSAWSRGGGENCLADNRRMWSINCIVTCMSFSLSTRYFHGLPPEAALMGNVDRAQKRQIPGYKRATKQGARRQDENGNLILSYQRLTAAAVAAAINA